MEILQFIFSSFWVFLGVGMLATIVFRGLAAIVLAWRAKL